MILFDLFVDVCGLWVLVFAGFRVVNLHVWCYWLILLLVVYLRVCVTLCFIVLLDMECGVRFDSLWIGLV